MFQKKKQTLKFYPQLNRIYSFCWAYEGTYVFQGQFIEKIPQHDYIDRLMHISADGQWIKYKIDLLRRNIPMKMMNSYEVILFYQSIPEIQIINLKTHQLNVIWLPEAYIIPGIQQHQTKLKVTEFYLFPQTQLIALVQQGNKKAGVLYYEYDKLKERKFQPVGQRFYEGDLINFRQVNDTSTMFCFYEATVVGGVVRNVAVFDAKEEIYYRKNFDYKQFFEIDYKYFSMELWECKPDLYLWQTHNYRLTPCGYTIKGFYYFDKKIKQVQNVDDEAEWVNCFINPTMERMNGTFACYNYYIKKFQPYAPHIYFLDKQDLSVIGIDQQQAGVNVFFYRFYVQDWDRNTISRIQWKSPFRSQITVITTTIVSKFSQKFVYMHLLLSIDQDFDDDLLLDALRVLVNDID